MQLLDGKLTSNTLKDEIAKEVSELLAKGGKKPHLAAILVGSNGASETYVGAKVKACEKVGFDWLFVLKSVGSVYTVPDSLPSKIVNCQK